MNVMRRRQRVVCRQLVEMVTDYLQGDLDAASRSAVEEHLAVCGHCTGYVEQVQRMLALTAAPEPELVPEALLDELTRAFRKRRG